MARHRFLTTLKMRYDRWLGCRRCILKILAACILATGFCRSDTVARGEAELYSGTDPLPKANNYFGIWYGIGQSGEYTYKYSGGMGTYCAKHRPFGIYSQEADKTFFVYGGTDRSNSTLYHMVSSYDHQGFAKKQVAGLP